LDSVGNIQVETCTRVDPSAISNKQSFARSWRAIAQKHPCLELTDCSTRGLSVIGKATSETVFECVPSERKMTSEKCLGSGTSDKPSVPAYEDFTILKPISRGSFGKVFLCHRNGNANNLYAM
ncbi:unnamed protein product, partial [Allacma fusca]